MDRLNFSRPAASSTQQTSPALPDQCPLSCSHSDPDRIRRPAQACAIGSERPFDPLVSGISGLLVGLWTSAAVHVASRQSGPRPQVNPAGAGAHGSHPAAGPSPSKLQAGAQAPADAFRGRNARFGTNRVAGVGPSGPGSSDSASLPQSARGARQHRSPRPNRRPLKLWAPEWIFLLQAWLPPPQKLFQCSLRNQQNMPAPASPPAVAVVRCSPRSLGDAATNSLATLLLQRGPGWASVSPPSCGVPPEQLAKTAPGLLGSWELKAIMLLSGCRQSEI